MRIPLVRVFGKLAEESNRIRIVIQRLLKGEMQAISNSLGGERVGFRDQVL
jgi:hypothetical protein